MNNIERLQKLLRERFPSAASSLDAPDNPAGSWWLDVILSGHHVVIEWRPAQGFGVSAPASDAYGVGPDEIYESTTATFERATELLLGQIPTMSPVDLALPRIRESRRLTQAEVATRMQINQATLSRIERRGDMFVGTLRDLVAAMGGRLELLAHFPDATVRIQFGDDAAPDGRARVA